MIDLSDPITAAEWKDYLRRQTLFRELVEELEHRQVQEQMRAYARRKKQLRAD